MPDIKQHKIETKVTAGGETISVKTEVVQGDLDLGFKKIIPPGSVDVEIVVSIPISTMLSIAFSCAKAAGQASELEFTEMTIKTNNTSTPGNGPFTITPKNGIQWSIGDDPTLNPNPFTSAITKLFVSNPGTAAGVLIVAGLVDSTPGLTG